MQVFIRAALIYSVCAFHLLLWNSPRLSAQEIQKISSLEPALDYLHASAPIYPDIARIRGWEGVVILKALIREDGVCSQVMIDQSSGHPVLDDAAAQAVKKWIFTPARLGDSSYRVMTKIPVRFILADPRKKLSSPARIQF